MLRVTTLLLKIESKVVHSCPVLCDPLDGSPPGSSVHWIFQARIMKWLLFRFPGDFPDPGIKSRSPALQGDSLPFEPLGELRLLLKDPF